MATTQELHLKAILDTSDVQAKLNQLRQQQLNLTSGATGNAAFSGNTPIGAKANVANLQNLSSLLTRLSTSINQLTSAVRQMNAQNLRTPTILPKGGSNASSSSPMFIGSNNINSAIQNSVRKFMLNSFDDIQKHGGNFKRIARAYKGGANGTGNWLDKAFFNSLGVPNDMPFYVWADSYKKNIGGYRDALLGSAGKTPLKSAFRVGRSAMTLAALPILNGAAEYANATGHEGIGTVAKAAGGITTGAIAGGYIGSMVAPGAGTALGAGIGAAAAFVGEAFSYLADKAKDLAAALEDAERVTKAARSNDKSWQQQMKNEEFKNLTETNNWEGVATRRDELQKKREELLAKLKASHVYRTTGSLENGAQLYAKDTANQIQYIKDNSSWYDFGYENTVKSIQQIRGDALDEFTQLRDDYIRNQAELEKYETAANGNTKNYTSFAGNVADIFRDQNLKNALESAQKSGDTSGLQEYKKRAQEAKEAASQKIDTLMKGGTGSFNAEDAAEVTAEYQKQLSIIEQIDRLEKNLADTANRKAEAEKKANESLNKRIDAALQDVTQYKIGKENDMWLQADYRDHFRSQPELDARRQLWLQTARKSQKEWEDNLAAARNETDSTKKAEWLEKAERAKDSMSFASGEAGKFSSEMISRLKDYLGRQTFDNSNVQDLGKMGFNMGEKLDNVDRQIQIWEEQRRIQMRIKDLLMERLPTDQDNTATLG